MKKQLFFSALLLTGMCMGSVGFAQTLMEKENAIKAELAILQPEVLVLANQQIYHSNCANLLTSTALSLEHTMTEASSLVLNDGSLSSYYAHRTQSNLNNAKRKFVQAAGATDCTDKTNFQAVYNQFDSISDAVSALGIA